MTEVPFAADVSPQVDPLDMQRWMDRKPVLWKCVKRGQQVVGVITDVVVTDDHKAIGTITITDRRAAEEISKWLSPISIHGCANDVDDRRDTKG